MKALIDFLLNDYRYYRSLGYGRLESHLIAMSRPPGDDYPDD